MAVHDRVLFGNPENLVKEPGMVIRLDRIEQDITKELNRNIGRSWKYATLVISVVVVGFQFLNLVLS